MEHYFDTIQNTYTYLGRARHMSNIQSIFLWRLDSLSFFCRTSCSDITELYVVGRGSHNDYHFPCVNGCREKDGEELWKIFTSQRSNYLYNAEIFVYKPWRPKGFVSIWNHLISFRFIEPPMLWFYSHSKYFYSFSAGTVFIHQNLTFTDVTFWRINRCGSSRV